MLDWFVFLGQNFVRSLDLGDGKEFTEFPGDIHGSSVH